MIWLYRLQQRLSITRHEGLAVLTLASLFLLGLTVRHLQEQQVPPVAVDSLVVQSQKAVSAQTASATQAPSPSPSADNPVNVNTASRQALTALPGIGPALSKRIEAYRSSQGRFQRIEELKRVSGIGPKTLATLRPMVQVRSPKTSAK
ncbi:MAG: ComEA family DNA-binding protein [Salinibacter sp.]